MLRERDKTIDCVKFVAILLVVVYHSYYLQKDGLPYFALYTLCSMGVPLFFFVNGALLLNSVKPFNLLNHCKKIAKIVFLTFLWGGVVLAIVKSLPFSQEISWIEYGKILLYMKTGYVINQYWFLRALVMIYIFYPLIKYTFDANKNSLFLFALLIFLLTFGNKVLFLLCQLFMYFTGQVLFSEVKNCIPWYNFFFGMPYAYALCYFIVGGLLYHCMRNNMIARLYRDKPLMNCGVFGISWIMSIILGLILTTKVKWDPCFNGYDLITTFVMTVCFFILLKKLRNIHMPRIFELIAQNTLGIYLVHGLLIYVSRPWIAGIVVLQNFAGLMFYVAAIVLVSLIIVLTIKRIPHLGWIVRL